MTIAEVYLRQTSTNKEVKVTSSDKPDIPMDIVKNWQSIVDIISEILDIPSGLIMKVDRESIEVFLSSQRLDNPYNKGDQESLKKGLYCETVIGQNKELLVEDALNNIHWKDNPDVKLGMISYYGLPILWPDEEIFGTVCVLDYKKNKFNEKYKRLIQEFKISIERDLKLLMINEALKKTSNIDVLTKVYNRRKCIDIIEEEINRSNRGESSFSLAIIDLDKFKDVNDTYGHESGDDLLIKFSNLFVNNIRSIDNFCRWGGDEFILICPSTDENGIHKLMGKIKGQLKEKADYFYSIDFSYGVASYKKSDSNYEKIILRADQKMYILKRSK